MTSIIGRIRDKFSSEVPVSTDPLVADLQSALAPERVRIDGAERSLLSHDASVFEDGNSGPVCFPESTAEVVSIMKIAAAHDRAVVPRGAGTGLAGGAIPLGAPVVVAMTKMNNILEVDEANAVAWVEPGVINLDLTNQLRPLGYHFAPDPSSQQVCTIGGNVANNSGGPHCLAYGVTNPHIVALEVVTAEGEVLQLGGLEPEPPGYDLRGVFVGSEGTLGIATKVAVRLTRNRPAVGTLLLSFDTVADAAKTVSDIIAAGIVPAALEVMDNRITVAVENYVHAGYPRDAAAVLLAEVDGLEEGVDLEAERIRQIGLANNARNVRLAADEQERALLWKGRKTAFGAIAQIAPDYYLHDTVVPRSKLAEMLDRDLCHCRQIRRLDHERISRRRRQPPSADLVRWARGGRARASARRRRRDHPGFAGCGWRAFWRTRHRVEKQKFMDKMFTDVDLEHQNRVRMAFDPGCRSNPGKVMPRGHSCADIQMLKRVPNEVWG